MKRDIINVDGLAVYLGISRPKAYELVHSEGFPRVTIGRRILIPVAALDQWLADQAAKSAGERWDNLGFVFLDSYYEATEDLPEDDAKLLYWALVRYAFAGEIVDLPPELSRLFKAFRPTVDSSIENYKNGKKGGRPRKKA